MTFLLEVAFTRGPRRSSEGEFGSPVILGVEGVSSERFHFDVQSSTITLLAEELVFM